jgi:hypothetical protein
MLWRLVERHDKVKLLEVIQEPTLSNRPNLFQRQTNFSGFNRLGPELYSIIETVPGISTDRFTIYELGAGYGRQGYAMLKAFLNCRCVVIDIPPALCISGILNGSISRAPDYAFQLRQ